MKALLISAIYQRDTNIDYYLAETTTLANTLDIEVVKIITQKLDKSDNSFYLQSGKIEQIKEFTKQHDIDIIITQHEISARIERNLTNQLNIKVIDRTNLILDIFYLHAQSKLAKTQIEIARLQYNLAKVIGSYSNLEKQGSSAVSRSSGESKAELDKRRIRDKVIHLKKELQTQEKIRDNKRHKRKQNNIPVISLVGYTNVGKSSILNALTSADRQILAKDQLFATLDTSVRRVETKLYGNFLFVDTVGFVSNLPHHLIEAFSSTFEEIAHSDIIVHVHDLSDDNDKIHTKVVNDTLYRLGVSSIPVIDIYNKSDLVMATNQLSISAKEPMTIDVLLHAISKCLNEHRKLTTLHFNYTQMNIYNQFKQNHQIIDEFIDQDGITITLYLNEQLVNEYNYLIKE